MSEKNRDNKKRWRCVTVSFRASPQESDTINMMVSDFGDDQAELLYQTIALRGHRCASKHSDSEVSS